MTLSEPLPPPYSTARRTDAVTPYRTTAHDPTARRQNVELIASVRVSGTDLCAHVCSLRSLSLGGAFIEHRRLPMDTLVNITFALPSSGRRLSVGAIVQWSSGDGVWVQFDGLRASEVCVLWDYLASVACDADSEPTKRIVRPLIR